MNNELIKFVISKFRDNNKVLNLVEQYKSTEKTLFSNEHLIKKEAIDLIYTELLNQENLNREHIDSLVEPLRIFVNRKLIEESESIFEVLLKYFEAI